MMSRQARLSLPGRILLAGIFLTGIFLPGCMSDPYKTKSFKNVFDHYREQEGIEAISFPPGIVGVFILTSA